MADAALLYQNLADGGTVTATSEVAGMEADLMITEPDILDDVWRSEGNDETLTFDLLEDKQIDSLGFLGLNLTASATIRVRISSEAGGATSGDILDQTFTIADPEFDINYRALVILLTSVEGARYVVLDIEDTTLDYLECGRAVIGCRNTFSFGFAPGSQMYWEDPSIVQESRGGQSLIWTREKYRVATIELQWISDDDRWGWVENMARVNGRTKDVFLFLDVSADSLPARSIWGLMPELPAPTYSAIFGIHAKRIVVKERL